VDRIKTRFWTEAHSSSKRGSRFRLYKRRTILGTNNAILVTPRVGAKEVMADYIEDLQLTNISTTGTLYSSGTRQNTIEIWNPTKPKNQKKVGSISTPIGFEALAFGPDGLLYSSGTRQNTIEIWDITKIRNKKNVGSISTPIGFEALAFGPDGLLYSSGQRQNTIQIWDTTKPRNQKNVGSISTPIGSEALVFDIKKTGTESLVSINLTLRSKEKYGKNKNFIKKDYSSGNFNFSKNDPYQRDTFSTTVAVRNL